jgi:carboxymethylenebutenolidase
MYQASAPVFLRQLGALSAILDKGEAFAAEKGLDASGLIDARLAPDMFPLSRQVQIATDSAKGAIARLAGVDAPVFADTESSFPELRERIARTIAFIGTIAPDRVDGSEEREIVLKINGNDVHFVGQPFLLHFALPNFFFHTAAAYAILRHQGVEIGKIDFSADYSPACAPVPQPAAIDVREVWKAPARRFNPASHPAAETSMPILTRPEGYLPEDFHVTRRTATGMFFAGYALAAFSAEAAPITTPADGLTIEEVTIPNGAPRPLPAYVARPRHGGRHAAIIVVNEIFGIHDYIKDVCRRLARLGYVAVAPDFFYRSGVNLPAIADMEKIRPVVAQASVEQVDGDVRATSAWLRTRPFAKPGRIGITGFCWGGAVVWRAAMVDPDIKAGVAWYGQVKPLIARAGEVKAPVLGLYGALDHGIAQADIQAMLAALRAAGKTGSDIRVYPDAQHGFHADYRDSYNEADAKDGWARMLAHFRANGVV